MDSQWIIGALAFMTIGFVGIIAVVHFGSHLRDKKNRDSAMNAIVEDGSSAHTAVRGGSTPEHMKGG